MDLFQVRMQVAEMADWVAQSFSEEMATLIKNDTYIAGGVFKSLILDEPVNDWDFFFKNNDSVIKFLELLQKEKYAHPSVLTNRDKIKLEKIEIITENAITFKFPKATIQFIIFHSAPPEEMIQKFDFHHTHAFYNPLTAEFSCPTHYIVGKELVYNSKAYAPLSAMKRAFKFVKQGWSISDLELEKLTKALVGVDWKDAEEVKKQTRGLYRTAAVPHPQEPNEARTVAQPTETGMDVLRAAYHDYVIPEPGQGYMLAGQILDGIADVTYTLTATGQLEQNPLNQ